ncbi:uncharacterized protein M421DRAFT_419256 [Didymella exigua CBS 183.55]|uniref:Uncharacterized protein n=1 Tax=Didymella exigua CBS 183.55 TaxID=1150837 RepID=A0A6A5RP52_9PLEO|nr:uncharacterized protein M421DRAFT_419256 [Didymella exigua CBS 183.55]KAF1930201.1 hypothetical protein M421DRAFT_419256 [Didymella exigua CBS 183.55]
MPFCFFDLPKELRFMIYKQLATTTTNTLDVYPLEEDSGFRLSYRYTRYAVGLLASCKLLNEEAEPFFQKALGEDNPETACSFTFTVDGREFENEWLCTMAVINLAFKLLKYQEEEFDIAVSFGKAQVPVVLQLCTYALDFVRKTGRRLGLEVQTEGLSQSDKILMSETLY